MGGLKGMVEEDRGVKMVGERGGKYWLEMKELKR